MIEEFEALVNRISYKPEFKFICTTRGLEIRHSTIDVYSLKPVIITHFFGYVPFETVSDPYDYMLFFIKNCIRSVELHEMDEWLKLDNIILDDPHKK